MKKTIGTDISFSGNINGPKLCREIEAGGIAAYTLEMDPDIGELYLTFDDVFESIINTILAVHDPASEPVRPSQEELNAQAIEEIIAMLMEGGEN